MRIGLTGFLLLATAIAAEAQRAVPSHAPGATTRATTIVARVNGVAIFGDRLDAAVNSLMPLESFHRNVSGAKLAELRQKALEGLVDEELRYQDGKSRRIKVSVAAVDAGLAKVRRKYKTRQAFEEARQRSGVSVQALRSAIRHALIAQRAYETAVTTACRVGADDAARFYAENTSRFIVPEQLHIYAITIRVDPSSTSRQWAEAKAVADDVLRQLRAGAPFDEMAKKYSTDPARNNGGDMGFVHRGSLADEFETATRDLKPGQISDVVQSLYGYHVVRVAEIRPATQKMFAEVAADIRKDLGARRCAEVNEAWMARLRAAATIELVDPAIGGGMSSHPDERRK